jgi:hypothetical protein
MTQGVKIAAAPGRPKQGQPRFHGKGAANAEGAQRRRLTCFSISVGAWDSDITHDYR